MTSYDNVGSKNKKVDIEFNVHDIIALKGTLKSKI
jgi:hypothetical protein